MFSFNLWDSLKNCEGWCKGSFHWPLPTYMLKAAMDRHWSRENRRMVFWWHCSARCQYSSLHQSALPNYMVICAFWRYLWMPCTLSDEPAVQGQGQALLVAMQVGPVLSGTENIHFRAVIYSRRKMYWLVVFNRYSFYSLPLWKQGRIIWKWTSF